MKEAIRAARSGWQFSGAGWQARLMAAAALVALIWLLVSLVAY